MDESEEKERKGGVGGKCRTVIGGTTKERKGEGLGKVACTRLWT